MVSFFFFFEGQVSCRESRALNCSVVLIKTKTPFSKPYLLLVIKL